MAVTLVSNGSLVGSTGADVTPAFLAAPALNDIGLLVTSARSNTVTCATPAGWTLLAGPIEGDALWRTYWFWKRCAGGDANPLCDWSGVTGDKYGRVQVWRGAITTGNPFAAQATTSGTADPGVATGVTTTAANQLVMSNGMSADNLATGVTITATDPASWSVSSYVVSGTGADAGHWTTGHAGMYRATAGATGNVSHDFNGVPLRWNILIAAMLEATAGETVTSGVGTINVSGVASSPASGMVTVTSGVGTINVSGVASSPASGMVTVASGVGVINVSGVAAEFPPAGETVTSGVGLVNIQGVAGSPASGMVTVASGVGTVNVSGVASSPASGMVTVASGVGVINVQGVAGDVAGEVASGVGQINVQGVASSPASGRVTIAGGVGTINVVGVAAPTVTAMEFVTSGVGTINVVGVASVPTGGETVVSGVGSILLVPVASDPRRWIVVGPSVRQRRVEV